MQHHTLHGLLGDVIFTGQTIGVDGGMLSHLPYLAEQLQQ